MKEKQKQTDLQSAFLIREKGEILPEEDSKKGEVAGEAKKTKHKKTAKKKTEVMDGGADPFMQESIKVTENIFLCPDGVYRWIYHFDMLKNPTILFTVWKVLGISFGVVWLFVMAIGLIADGLSSLEQAGGIAQTFLILMGVFFVISIIAYLIVAGLYGWKYKVLFEMTEDHVTHVQMPEQFKKAQGIGLLTTVVGGMAGKPYMVGLGSHVSTKQTMTSEFKSVEFVKVRRKRHTIHVDYLFDKNQVYAEDADFDFVEKFILDRCVKAKIKK